MLIENVPLNSSQISACVCTRVCACVRVCVCVRVFVWETHFAMIHAEILNKVFYDPTLNVSGTKGGIRSWKCGFISNCLTTTEKIFSFNNTPMFIFGSIFFILKGILKLLITNKKNCFRANTLRFHSISREIQLVALSIIVSFH